MATITPPPPATTAAAAEDPPRAADADGELVDIVDRSTNAVTGTAPRSAVHAAAAWHRCVHVYLFHPDGRLLLQRRSPAKRHVVAGECAPAAAVRGVAEELGVPVAAALRGGRLVRVRPPFEVVGDYAGAGPGGGVLRERELVAAVAWVPCADVEARVAAGRAGEFTPWFAKEAAEFPPSAVYEALLAGLAEGE
ncbi:hypothetical protein BU14_0401s0003 [Porphyra umbilicalis]|uniref:Nudix hydrolase domain-containing protein n=1 Tax=Porphyra umbilicalis TaxID=2786 RepID=A0A1X6NW82_PORUM|nr:hypothetical protein BU14_0401s0003 [Porphyra umbilicalis]|eukprot:OSX72832.1 hypothetical protein BU14_0401s0003 [Porphyra umbilicalis]